MEWLLHTVGVNERWDHLAYHYYGDANRIAPIIEANRTLFGGGLGPIPAQLPHGLVLRIPLLPDEAVDQTQLPPWKRGTP